VSHNRAVESQEPDTNILEFDPLIETLQDTNQYHRGQNSKVLIAMSDLKEKIIKFECNNVML
jgi:hypothetical protein